MFDRTKLEARLNKLELEQKQRNCEHRFRTVEVYKANSISEIIEIFADCEKCGLTISRDLKSSKVKEAYELLLSECK